MVVAILFLQMNLKISMSLGVKIECLRVFFNIPPALEIDEKIWVASLGDGLVLNYLGAQTVPVNQAGVNQLQIDRTTTKI